MDIRMSESRDAGWMGRQGCGAEVEGGWVSARWRDAWVQDG